MAPKDDETPEKAERLSVSRRDFLKSAGVTGLAATVAGVAEPEAQTGAQVVGPGEVPVRLNVNGRNIDLRIEPRVTLLDALRMRADLTGNKRVCDRGTCGACTMIVDNRAVYSCSTLAIDTVGKRVRSVDGLSTGNTLHAVQQAFVDQDALMCGFCTPGFIMATVAFTERNKNFTKQQLAKGLDGNICRCGTFVRILEAGMKVGGARA